MPECETFAQALAPAAAAIGVKFRQVVVSGTSAQAAANAFSTAAQLHPLAIIDPGIPPALWGATRETLKAEHIPVVCSAVVPESSCATEVAGLSSEENVGRVQADYVYTQAGNHANIVLLDTPEVSDTSSAIGPFTAQYHSLCGKCQVSILDIPESQLGTTAGNTVTSYLQGHTGVNWVVGLFGSQFIGVPEALKAAGLDVTLFSGSGESQNFQYVKTGEQNSVLAVDEVQLSWIAMDQAVRAGTNQPIPTDEQDPYPSSQILTKPDITFDVNAPWVAYPDYQAQFKRLWAQAK